jgi:hypothetical protein
LQGFIRYVTGYTQLPMETVGLEQEMNYPNPVERSDLPVKRRRWPKLVIGAGALVLLTVVFLPQILSSRVGRKMVVGYISGITNSPVTVESVSTSWFGGTTIRHLTIKDPMGRRIGFKQLRCEASLWKLLSGRYDLGDCTIDDLSIEYVINDGRGKDSLDYMSEAAKGPAGAPVPTAAGSKELPHISGKIKLNNATLMLWRGTVQPKLFDVTWERARFNAINGEFDIASLDKPWKYSLSAVSVEDGSEQKGAMASSGTVDLGEGGKFSADDLTADVTLDGADVRAGPLAAVIIPTLSNREARDIFGPALKKLKLAVKAADGEVIVQSLDIESPVSKVAARGTIDVTSTPPLLSISSDSTGGSEAGKPVTIALGVSKRLGAQWFVYFNPFFREVVGGPGSGVVTVTIDSLSMPLNAGWPTMNAQGRVKAHGVKLARVDEMHGEESTPDNLASQLAMLVGDAMENVPLDCEAAFNVAGGTVKVDSMPVSVGPIAMTMSGTTDLVSDAVEMKVAIALSPATAIAPGVTIPPLVGALAQAKAVFAIGGTVDRPQLMLGRPAGNLDAGTLKMLSDQINAQVVKLRAKEAQRQMQKSQKEMDEILKPLRGMDQQHRAATQRATTTTAPATMPK